VFADLFPDCRKSVGERNDMLILRAFPNLTKPRVIAVLLSSLGVSSGRLNMAVGKRADPDISPRRGNGKRLDASKGILGG